MIKSYLDAKSIVTQGEVNDLPSLTQPDLAFSVRQLHDMYSVGRLPTLAELQEYIEGEEWQDDDDVVLDASNDLRSDDKVDMVEKFMRANAVNKSIYDKVKSFISRKNQTENKE